MVLYVQTESPRSHRMGGRGTEHAVWFRSKLSVTIPAMHLGSDPKMFAQDVPRVQQDWELPREAPALEEHPGLELLHQRAGILGAVRSAQAGSTDFTVLLALYLRGSGDVVLSSVVIPPPHLKAGLCPSPSASRVNNPIKP